jgi:hypothetical protein
VVNRFRGLVRVVGRAANPRETQRVLVECGVKITGVVGEAERAGRMQDRHPDLQQQSDRGKRPAETPAPPAGSSALLSPQPYRHIEGARHELEMTSLPIGQ